MRYFLEIAYQGTHYHGWQVQQNATTVQGVLQAKLSQLLRQDVKVVGSSRTDRGVHARQQFAHLDVAVPIDSQQLLHRLNAVLPKDIALVAIKPVKPTAHARFDASSRTYQYTILQVRDPFQHATSYLRYSALDVVSMNRAATHLCGQQDFQGFSKAHTDVTHNLCTVYEAFWTQQAAQLQFQIRANRFLRGMVRFIVSHLLQVGKGLLTEAAFAALLEAKTRCAAVPLVPAHGLALVAVAYPTAIFSTPAPITN